MNVKILKIKYFPSWENNYFSHFFTFEIVFLITSLPIRDCQLSLRMAKMCWNKTTQKWILIFPKRQFVKNNEKRNYNYYKINTELYFALMKVIQKEINKKYNKKVVKLD